MILDICLYKMATIRKYGEIEFKETLNKEGSVIENKDSIRQVAITADKVVHLIFVIIRQKNNTLPKLCIIEFEDTLNAGGSAEAAVVEIKDSIRKVAIVVDGVAPGNIEIILPANVSPDQKAEIEEKAGVFVALGHTFTLVTGPRCLS